MRNFAIQLLLMVMSQGDQADAWLFTESTQTGSNLREKPSRSVLPVIDEKVHGTSSIPRLAFDSLISEYAAA